MHKTITENTPTLGERIGLAIPFLNVTMATGLAQKTQQRQAAQKQLDSLETGLLQAGRLDLLPALGEYLTPAAQAAIDATRAARQQQFQQEHALQAPLRAITNDPVSLDQYGAAGPALTPVLRDFDPARLNLTPGPGDISQRFGDFAQHSPELFTYLLTRTLGPPGSCRLCPPPLPAMLARAPLFSIQGPILSLECATECATCVTSKVATAMTPRGSLRPTRQAPVTSLRPAPFLRLSPCKAPLDLLPCILRPMRRKC